MRSTPLSCRVHPSTAFRVSLFLCVRTSPLAVCVCVCACVHLYLRWCARVKEPHRTQGEEFRGVESQAPATVNTSAEVRRTNEKRSKEEIGTLITGLTPPRLSIPHIEPQQKRGESHDQP